MPTDYISTTKNFTRGSTGGIGTNNILLVGRSVQATSGYGVVKEVKNLNEAYVEYGSSDENASDLINMVDAVFRQENAPEKIYCVAVGKWTNGATDTTTAIAAVGATSFELTDASTLGISAGDIFKVSATGKQDQFFRAKTVVIDTVTVEDYEQNGIALDAGATVTLIDDAAANHANAAAYESSLATALTMPASSGGKIQFVVIDSWYKEDIAKLKAHVDLAIIEERDRIGFFGFGGYSSNVAAINAVASDALIESHMMVAIAPLCALDDENEIMRSGEYVANIASVILGKADPAEPVHGLGLNGTSGLAYEFKKSEILLLRNGGVTVLYTDDSGNVVIEGGVTTNTDTDYPIDLEISHTALIVNDYLVSSLKSKHGREKATDATLTKVKNSLTVDMEGFAGRDIIDSREGKEWSVSVGYDDTNPRQMNVLVSYYPIYAIKKIAFTTNIVLQ